MELRYLRYFIAIAEELSFSKAAERLHISQPPLSQQIQRLEAEIGVTLLKRTKRSVELTAPGKVFLKKAYWAIEQTEDAIESARRADRGEIGKLAIGFVASASLGFFPRVIQEFRAAFPNVAMELRDLTTTEQLQRLEEKKLDLAFLRPPITGSNLESLSVVRESFILALPEGHPLASLDVVPLEALREEPFLVVPQALAPGLYGQVMDMCASSGFRPRIYQEIGQLDIIINFVAARLGVSLLPKSIQVLHREGAVYRPIAPSNIFAEIIAVWSRANDSTPLRNFLDIIRNEDHDEG